MSMRARKRIEQCFGGGKTVVPLAPNIGARTGQIKWLLTKTMAAYNLIRSRVLAEYRLQVAQ